MTTQIKEQTDTSPKSQVDSPETVSIRVEDLIVGRRINHPIYDRNGVLLLASGSVVNSRFKQLLRDRKMSQVDVHSDDASAVSLGALAGDPMLEAANQGIFSTELTEKLDRLIESGSMFVANTGPAVRNSMVMHGCKAYDPDHRDKLFEQQQKFGESLDG
ncbi:MAG TPA: hypothetical protein DDZ90_20330, partial [Planctomycetaceae bacterium]|nr:hypothetical protein [Planctomycetaceae bacterium]